jgi:dienelactone hydrolase
MLFLQGTRDELADLQLLKALVDRLGARATLELFEDADHSFHVPARTGRKDPEVLAQVLDTLARWIAATLSNGARA